MPSKKRTKPPRTIEKRVFQQAGSQCAFCEASEIASLQVHHIDGNPDNHEVENLLLVCANCHGKITGGVISEAEVRTKKRQLDWSPPSASTRSPAVSVSINASQFRGDIAHTITKITTPRAPRTKHPEGSIGADVRKKGYIDYLLARYRKFREADSYYGRRDKYSPSEIHKTIQSVFGYLTFFMPVEFFPKLVDFLQWRIGRTIQAQRNTSRGIPSFHSYEEHLRRHGPKGEGVG